MEQKNSKMISSPEIPTSWQPGMTLADIEKATIIRAFDYFKENKTQTAQALDISIRTLDNKLTEYKKAPAASMYAKNELHRKIRAAIIHFGDENMAQVARVCGLSLAQLDEHRREMSKEASGGKELTKEQETKSTQRQQGSGVSTQAG